MPKSKISYLYFSYKFYDEKGLENYLIDHYSECSEFAKNVNLIITQFLAEAGGNKAQYIACDLFQKALSSIVPVSIRFPTKPLDDENVTPEAIIKPIYCDESLYKLYKRIECLPITYIYTLLSGEYSAFTKITKAFQEAKEHKKIYRNSELIEEYLWLYFRKKFESRNELLIKIKQELANLRLTDRLDLSSVSLNQTVADVNNSSKKSNTDKQETILNSSQTPSEFHQKLIEIVRKGKEKLDRRRPQEVDEEKIEASFWFRRKQELKYLKHGLERSQIFIENVPSVRKNEGDKISFFNSVSKRPADLPGKYRPDASYYENTELHKRYPKLYDDTELYKLCRRICANTKKSSFNFSLNEVICEIEDLLKQVKAGKVKIYRNAPHIRQFLKRSYQEKVDQVEKELEAIRREVVQSYESDPLPFRNFF